MLNLKVKLQHWLVAVPSQLTLDSERRRPLILGKLLGIGKVYLSLAIVPEGVDVIRHEAA